MKAIRWILFSLLAFGLGTGIALAVRPPSIGIPTATAAKLGDDLAKIQQYASEGNCNAVRGRLNGAASKIDKLPDRTSTATVNKLTDSLSTVRTEALSACQRVNAEKLAAEQREREAQATPTPEPTIEATPEPEEPITPEGEETTPDPGTAPTTPQDPSGGAGLGDDQGGDTTGGIGLPGEEAVRQQVDEARREWRKRAKELRKALNR